MTTTEPAPAEQDDIPPGSIWCTLYLLSGTSLTLDLNAEQVTMIREALSAGEGSLIFRDHGLGLTLIPVRAIAYIQIPPGLGG